jgi:peptidoglycan/xylan/chitin deacetylase (PgdA/CDA1 family)
MLSPDFIPLSVPAGTICLTFDDGPGARTLAIAELLAKNKMRATFFILGKQVAKYPRTVGRVRALGHWLGNHPFSHPSLARLVAKGGKAIAITEIVRTDRLIVDLIGDGPFLLRPPYGDWSPDVADALNRSDELQKYVGPIFWDIQCADWQIGGMRNDKPWTLEQCRAEYLREIESRCGGVVLMHDISPDPKKIGAGTQAVNRTFELVEWLVARIAGRYEFKGLDELIPAT